MLTPSGRHWKREKGKGKREKGKGRTGVTVPADRL
jgi:hypothetical protein